ncbi:hypothetical protein QFC21_001428 [Naganishia friedmannii]|uniref:Uncharacterized protein n=1 Tax=Naganishia friedmannii TaxID=89922 RepID=A0ACC2W3K9_9TREE|nr:hypothetical protein QFC21_001428 [Naganishia friedmannii]
MATAGHTIPVGMNPIPIQPTMDASNLEYAETQSVTMEWKLSGLREIFDKSKGDIKSKCLKSAVFGDPDNLWEIIFYPNSGSPSSAANQNHLPGVPNNPNSGGEYSSFYLSAVPTDEEKAHAVKGKWTRKGLFAFRFEVKSFARRDTLFYQAPPIVRQMDCFVISCTVSSGACPPAGSWLNMYGALPTSVSPSSNAFAASGAGWKGAEGAWKGVSGGNGAIAGARKLLPKSIVDSVGSLFDDEAYSDVEFWLPVRRRTRSEDNARGETHAEDRLTDSIHQEQEGDSMATTTNTIAGAPNVTDVAPGNLFASATSTDADFATHSSSQVTKPHSSSDPEDVKPTVTMASSPTSPLRASNPYYRKIWANKKILRRGEFFGDLLFGGFTEGADPPSHPGSPSDDSDLYGWDDSDIEEEMGSDGEEQAAQSSIRPRIRESTGNGPRKTKIVIRDAAYKTWQALIYYLYTDEITFAPLASTFIPVESESVDHPGSATFPAVPQSRSTRAPNTTTPLIDNGIAGRKEWIMTWLSERQANENWPENAPKPCSAKAIFRLADKMDLPSLRQRAFQHIISQMTVQNIPYEVFSQFSATYEDVRQIQVNFFLEHWTEIKCSPAMRTIWHNIRFGKHQGFEAVWPYIVSHLEFTPDKPTVEENEGQTGGGVHFADF